MPQNSKRTKKRVETILTMIADGARVIDACKAAGIGRTTYFDWRQDDEDLEKAHQAAIKLGVEALEDVALSRAVDGVEKPVGFHQGEHMGTFVREYSDDLLKFIMKARDPEKYGDRQKLEHTGKDGAPIVPVINLSVGPQTSS